VTQASRKVKKKATEEIEKVKVKVRMTVERRGGCIVSAECCVSVLNYPTALALLRVVRREVGSFYLLFKKYYLFGMRRIDAGWRDQTRD